MNTIRNIFTRLFSTYTVTIVWDKRIIKHRSWTLRDANEWVSAYSNTPEVTTMISRRW